MVFRKLAILVLLLMFAWAAPAFAQSSQGATSRWDQETVLHANNHPITVYRDPACSCCHRWVAHLKNHGFQVEDVPTDGVDAIKQQHGLPSGLTSCHTAIVEGYVMEGHVPADDIKRFLQARPNLVGLAVPDMPNGTPGMEVGDRKDPFSVMAFDRNGQTQVFKTYESY